MEEPKKHISPWMAWSIVGFIVIVVGISFWYFNKQITDIYNKSVFVTTEKPTATTTTTPASTTTPTPTTTTAADWKTYNNSTYNFTMTFTDGWEGLKVVQRKNTNDPLVYDDIYFAIPTKTDWTESGLAELNAYATPMVISVYTLDNWDTMLAQAEGAVQAAEITRNETYVFAWSQWQACPTDLCDNNLDFTNLIKTFKLN